MRRLTEAWRDPGWPDEATPWIDGALVRAGLERTGAIEQPTSHPS